MKAIWNGKIVAESAQTVAVEGNQYFPPQALRWEFFRDSDHHTVCGWKGTASYFHVVVDGKVNENAAWYYPETKDAAKKIERYVAFWKRVAVDP